MGHTFARARVRPPVRAPRLTLGHPGTFWPTSNVRRGGDFHDFYPPTRVKEHVFYYRALKATKTSERRNSRLTHYHLCRDAAMGGCSDVSERGSASCAARCVRCDVCGDVGCVSSHAFGWVSAGSRAGSTARASARSLPSSHRNSGWIQKAKNI